MAIHRSPLLKDRLDAAREDYAHARQTLMHQMIQDEPDPVRARLIADCIKWELSKVLPRFYGDRVAIDAPDGISFALNIARPIAKA